MPFGWLNYYQEIPMNHVVSDRYKEGQLGLLDNTHDDIFQLMPQNRMAVLVRGFSTGSIGFPYDSVYKFKKR